jgi:hypothetical protein
MTQLCHENDAYSNHFFALSPHHTRVPSPDMPLSAIVDDVIISDAATTTQIEYV